MKYEIFLSFEENITDPMRRLTQPQQAAAKISPDPGQKFGLNEPTSTLFKFTRTYYYAL